MERKILRWSGRSLLAALCLMLLAAGSEARERVYVGAYDFPPYLDVEDGMPVGGIVVTLIERMNALQRDYEFELYFTSPARRFVDLEAGHFSVMLFENPEWGWDTNVVSAVPLPEMFDDREIYIARAAPGRDQTYFDDFTERRMAGILSYHYAFADFNNNPDDLRNRFNMVLVSTQSALVQLVLKGRADIAVVSQVYLQRYLQENPDRVQQLLVSERYDQIYQHHVLAVSEQVGLAELIAQWMHELAPAALERQ